MIMTIQQIKALVHTFLKAIHQISVGALFLVLTPAAMAPYTASRGYDEPVSGFFLIGWLAVCMLLSVLHFVNGFWNIRTLHKATGDEIVCSKAASEYLEDRKSSCIKWSIIGFITAAFLVFIGGLCLFTSSNFFRSENPYYMATYLGAYISFAAAIGVIFGTIVKLFLLKWFQYKASAEFDEAIPEKRKRHWGRFLLITAGALLLVLALMVRGTWYIMPFISTIPAVEHRQLQIDYDDDTGVYTLHSPDETDFKVLQLSDIHLGGSLISYSKDINALQTVYDLIEETKPDFIIVTGDFVFPLGILSFSFNNFTPMMQFCSFMRNIGIPWALTYGNHDTEFIATHSAEELEEMFRQFSYGNTGNLLYPLVQPQITGHSNQMIKLQNADESMNQLLFLLDSNSYTGEGINDYDYIHDDQVAWYKEAVETVSRQEGKLIPSMLFFHIPLKEYETAYQMYKAGDAAVGYFYGKIGESNENICCSEYPSHLFETAKELGSTKYIFCGHDHYNTISLEYQGIRLSYGRSIDYLAMPGISSSTEQRGATLIKIHRNGTADIESILYRPKR